jgi:2-dehydro-3-deoxygalactonokinase
MIAVDWGTSSFRAYRLDAAGAVHDQRSAAAGLLSCDGRFAAVLAQQLEGWDDEQVLMAGMVGSRSGWREVPYVACPAGLEQIAAGVVELDAAALPGRRVAIVPGVSQREAGTPPDVMRGEETQVFGLLERLAGSGPHTVCLPGTHSKWVQVHEGRIVSLRTAMTGEMYALLRRHSLLAALMPAPDEGDADDPGAFAQGVAASAADGGLAHQLFGVRTLGLFGELGPAGAPSYLSGLLIGHELRALHSGGGGVVHLVGGATLVQRYLRTLALLGAAAQAHGEDLSAAGLHRIATARSLRG